MRSHYWTIGPFADWLRGTPKLKCGTSEEWNAWEDKAKAAYPVRWWIAEEGLDYVQKFVYYIPDRLNDVRYYINNRWVSRSHGLTAHPRDIRPGNWSDVGNRFLPCMFNELVDFVEIEQAWHHCMWSDDAKTKFDVPWWRKGWLRWRTWRCPEAGMEYLKWASSLTVGEDMGAWLQGTVVERQADWHLCRVAFEGGQMWLRDTGVALGQMVRMRVLARDVSIATELPLHTSIQNQLSAVIEAVAPDAHPSQVLVRLRVGPWAVLARITQKAVDALALAPSMPVWAQVKSVALID